MKVVKITIAEFLDIPMQQKADVLGKSEKGFSCVATATQGGAVICEYTYPDWDFNATVLVVPVLDTGFCQIIAV